MWKKIIVMNIAVMKFKGLTMPCIELREWHGLQDLQDVQDVQWYVYFNMRIKLASFACEFFCV